MRRPFGRARRALAIPAINDEPWPDQAPSIEDFIIAAAAAPPALHSRPSASQKIYLNFTGCAAANWGGYPGAYSPAYDSDGDPSNFSASETTAITAIWQRVSEDFAPFNLDVTTEHPGSFASKTALEVCIGGSWSLWYGSSAGGVAYVGSWRNSPNTWRVWVFEDNLGNGNAKYVAEASSHEAGHALGLFHHSSDDGVCTDSYNPGVGSGETGWAPIMGVGYSRNWTLWWDGPTPSGCSYRQADVELITHVSNNITFRADDYGNTVGTAGALSVSGTSVSKSGVIEQLTDADVFSFTTGAGTITITGSNFEPGPNLDIALRLLSSGGSEILSAAPAATLDASFSTTVAAGTYYLEVKSGGTYGSLGQYTISGTIVSAGGDTTLPTASVNSASNVTSAGGTSYSFSIRYQDNVAVNVSSLGTGDIVVSKSGFSQTATFVSVDVGTNGTPRTATYSITPPGGSWDSGDNATYTISLQSNQVTDTSANAAASGSLGTFLVSIAAPADTDSDGVPDASDNCPTVSNSSQTNTDGDAQGDACDSDDDNDGTNDGSDCSPLNPSMWRNQAYSDPDGDGVRNSTTLTSVACFGATPPAGYTMAVNGPDNCTTIANPTQTNTDGDAQGDACDTDDDNDGTPDSSDCSPLNNGFWRDKAYPDPDNDGVRNSTTLTGVECYGAAAPAGYTAAANGPDNCPSVSNSSQANADGDAQGDACDADDDNDGTVDTSDCSPLDSAAWRDKAYRDADSDGVREETALVTVACYGAVVPSGYTLNATAPDNCPLTPNTAQTDTDRDGRGDACELDADNDGVLDTADCAPLDPARYRNQAYGDADNDGFRDPAPQTVACYGADYPAGYYPESAPVDNCPKVANPTQEDVDGNGIGNACDVQRRGKKVKLDFDGDGKSDLAKRSSVPGNPLASQYEIYRTSDGLVPVVPFGSLLTIAAPADYTGDGLADLAEVQPADGLLLWRIRDTARQTVSERYFGLATGGVLSGCDFSGDGIDDMAVIQGGQLFYRDSWTGETVVPGFSLAPTTLPGSISCDDLNGDGVAEILSIWSKPGKKAAEYTFTPKYAQLHISTPSGAVLMAISAKNAVGTIAVDSNGDGVLEAGAVFVSNKKYSAKLYAPGRKKALSIKLTGATGTFTSMALAGLPDGRPESLMYTDAYGRIFAIDTRAPKKVVQLGTAAPGALLSSSAFVPGL